MRLFTTFIVVLAVSISLLAAETPSDRNKYRMAFEHEKNGEYHKAEQIYEDLYESSPGNFNYFSRYKQVLAKQRKFEEMIPLLEKRIKDRSHDQYFRLELGLLFYADDQKDKARKNWSFVFRGKTKGQQSNYANYIYRHVLEYGLGPQLYAIVLDLRRITGSEDLLVQHLFTVCVHYRDWEHAADEVRHIAETRPQDLRFVRPALFKQPADSPLYDRIVGRIGNIDTIPVKIFLSEVYTHIEKYEVAFDILNEKPQDPEMQKALAEFAGRMFKKNAYSYSFKAAEQLAERSPDPEIKTEMELLAARSHEERFYRHEKKHTFIPGPYSSVFTDIRFRSYDMGYAGEIEKALRTYDSLAAGPPPVSNIAAFRRAEILYLVYHDFDSALETYIDLSATCPEQLKIQVLSRISDLYISRGEYHKAREFIQNAGERYRLMVHEEDRLMPQALYTTFLSGEMDSLKIRIEQTLALLPEKDVLYNDILNFAGFIFEGMKDSLNRNEWLRAERMLTQNHISGALELFNSLLQKRSPALALYGMRFLDCIRLLNEEEREEEFWENYYETLIDTEAGDFFMLRYAEFMEKTNNLKKAVSLYEKYLLSYRESMYYETIREYVRDIKSTGAP
ncbi:MAG: hypothetical protein U5N56_05970 [Candidatus Marinimicrobia bacterium]|nr:hypothetical protein [Candidatus Neomarinimicrobiota bacterium]